jgi:hypothetical protein
VASRANPLHGAPKPVRLARAHCAGLSPSRVGARVDTCLAHVRSIDEGWLGAPTNLPRWGGRADPRPIQATLNAAYGVRSTARIIGTDNTVTRAITSSSIPARWAPWRCTCGTPTVRVGRKRTPGGRRRAPLESRRVPLECRSALRITDFHGLWWTERVARLLVDFGPTKRYPAWLGQQGWQDLNPRPTVLETAAPPSLCRSVEQFSARQTSTSDPEPTLVS